MQMKNNSNYTSISHKHCILESIFISHYRALFYVGSYIRAIRENKQQDPLVFFQHQQLASNFTLNKRKEKIFYVVCFTNITNRTFIICVQRTDRKCGSVKDNPQHHT